MGIRLPGAFPFNLNSAVDNLLKNEFDIYRNQKKAHPLMEEFGVDAIPFTHEKMDEWRDALRRGIQYLHEPTNMILTGGIDDVWVNPKGELHLVDYKATSKKTEVSIDAPWQVVYKRQIEVYQWLFHQNGFQVNPTAYFVYCNGDGERESFEDTLHFKTKIIAYEGNYGWVDAALERAKKCLMMEKLPRANGDCEYCQYRKAVHNSLASAPPPTKRKSPNGSISQPLPQ